MQLMALPSPPSSKKEPTPVHGSCFRLLLIPPSPPPHHHYHHHHPIKNKGKTSTKPTFLLLPKTYTLITITSISFILSTLFISSCLSPSLLNPTIHKNTTTTTTMIDNPPPFAFHKLGTLFRKGTRAMEELIVGHLPEATTESDLRLFTRELHSSGVTLKSDVVFIYGSSSSFSFSLRSLLEKEEAYFFEQLRNTTLGFHGRRGRRERRGAFWGGKGGTEGGDLIYGSLVGFSTSDLEPENTLAGVLGYEPETGMRRWGCYIMLLGRLRRRYKRVLLLDVKNTAVIGDPFVHAGRDHAGGGDFVVFWKREEEEDGGGRRRRRVVVEEGVIMGGERGVRRLAKYMAGGIVAAAAAAAAAAAEGKRKEFRESVVLSEVVGGGLGRSRVEVFLVAAAREGSSPVGIVVAGGGVVLRRKDGRE